MSKELIRELKKDDISIYKMVSSTENFNKYIVSTPQTRMICNDPTISGLNYTRSLEKACTSVFKNIDFGIKEKETVVVDILRGALNFGLRDALCDAYGWNNHNTSFISAQRARNKKDQEEWYITEKGYQKLYFPSKVSWVLGDVVATGTSLTYALEEMIKSAVKQGVELTSIVFFTYGGKKAEEILSNLDKKCRKIFKNYTSTNLIYLEGCFTVPDNSTPLSVRLTGTDLLRYNATMAPEFIESQYECPSYPIERCIIYDAGSRAFCIPEFAEDVRDYWNQNFQFAQRGMSFKDLLKERFPNLDAEKFGNVDLEDLSKKQIKKMEKIINYTK